MADFGVVVFPGSNCDEDCARAVRRLGHGSVKVWHEETSLGGIDCVIIPGGFSYGDYLRTGVMASFSPVMEEIRSFVRAGKPVIGICNGFQILAECGLLSGAFVRNSSLRFVCDWTYVRVENTGTPFTSAFKKGEVLRIPVANGEGAFFCREDKIAEMESKEQIVFRYCSADGDVTAEANPNGSVSAIAGVCGAANVLGMMPHPERCCDEVLGGDDGAGIFESVAEFISHSG
ncbi:phosphoribosylformylglycinamidine synthase I [Candidatus Mycalebacterium sp.]